MSDYEDYKPLAKDDGLCEAHRAISTPHCPICLIQERDRLREQLEEYKWVAEVLDGELANEIRSNQ